MNPRVAVALTLLYYILYPFYWILFYLVTALLAVALFFVHPVYSVILFVVQPIIYVGVFISQLAYLPIDLIRRFETLYIYIGVGAIVGLTTGLLLHTTFTLLVGALGLRSARPVKGPTAKEHREARHRRAANATPFSPQLSPPGERIVHKAEPRLEPEKPAKHAKQDRMRLSALPKLMLQGPSPDGKRSLYAQTMDDDADSDGL